MTNEQNDKQFHDLFRQTLSEYRPEGNLEKDWGKLYPNLQRRPPVIWWFLGGLVVLICFVLGIIFYSKNTDNQIVIDKNDSIKHPLQGLKSKGFISENSVKNPPKKLTISSKFQNNFTDKKRANDEIIEPKDPSERYIFGGNLSFIQSKPILNLPVKQMILNHKIEYLSPEENDIKYQMTLGEFGEDSTTYQLLNRKMRAWSNSVIVSDFTTSMYPYSTQIFAWLKKNARNPNIKGTVFFTDCDSLDNQTQPRGMSGQMFVTKEINPNIVLPIMLNATRNTQNNRDAEENDLEALLYAQKSFPDSKHLILIADNDAPPKDMYLLSQIKKPVHVVLCGTTRDSAQAFHPAYFEIAQKTNGSLHTLEDDIDPNKLDHNSWIKVGKIYYHYNPHKQQFKVSKFKHRPRKLLGFLWF